MADSTSSTDVALQPIRSGINLIQHKLSPNTPLNITSNFLTLERTGVRLHYLRSGAALSSPSCRGVLLFIHGWPDLSFGWRYQIAYFTALNFMCLVPDQ